MAYLKEDEKCYTMLLLCEQVYPVLVGDGVYPYERRVGADYTFTVPQLF